MSRELRELREWAACYYCLRSAGQDVTDLEHFSKR